MSDSIVRSVRIDNDLFKGFDEKYGKAFLSKYINQAIKFALKSKECFSLIFWNEFYKTYVEGSDDSFSIINN